VSEPPSLSEFVWMVETTSGSNFKHYYVGASSNDEARRLVSKTHPWIQLVRVGKVRNVEGLLTDEIVSAGEGPFAGSLIPSRGFHSRPPHASKEALGWTT